MPNHIQNKLQIIGSNSQVKKVLSFISSKDDNGKDVQIDFNKIVPMPKGLMVETHSQVIEWAEICTCQIDFSGLFTGSNLNLSSAFKDGKYADITKRLKANTAMECIAGKRKNIKDFSGEEFQQFIQCLTNIRDHGFTTWYEWSIANWCTKWNAYEQNDKRNTSDTIFFQSAWSSPIGLIGKLSEKFTDVNIIITYADEDSGSNTGRIVFKSGEAIEIYQPEGGSKEGYELYFELHPDSRDNYKLVNDKYEYVEED